ncbi:chloride conductance regulatory protein ICln [Phalaenopsis equestris]|uniref:chloride conductance regulatory protein ICln n=1 Tax=Phalaenopsis equestris TaxID=78828 RepID=UPI0009E529C6|nr:chloride conductance regulatory protein ICln [Phalaenopsis equestris]
MILGLKDFTDRIGEGIGQPRLDFAGGEELMHVQDGVAIVLGCRSPESPGTLYISTRRVIWLSDTVRDRGYAVDFLSVSLHAVSRDPVAYPSPCIYTQIEVEAAEDDDPEGLDDECPDEIDISKITEMRLVPYDPNQLDTLFDIFCQCVELNPEPLEGEDEENNWVFGDEGLSEYGDLSAWQLSEDLPNPIGHANGHHELAHSVLHLQINDQRFEDAEEMEDGNHI